MTGGTLLISGNVGHEIGLRMRRGLIAVGGAAGDLIGFNLIAGTILVFGNGGQRPGAGMRRGTIGLFGPRVPQLLPSFRYANTYASPVLPLLLRELQSHQFAVAPDLFQAEFDYHQGDFVTTGRGEILLPRAGCK
jgi:formylmethanofuran dehydrogenase subunit C